MEGFFLHKKRSADNRADQRPYSLKGGNREVGLIIGYPVRRILIIKKRIFFMFSVPAEKRFRSSFQKKYPPTSPAGQDLHFSKRGK
jgi:hypothetical protein